MVGDVGVVAGGPLLHFVELVGEEGRVADPLGLAEEAAERVDVVPGAGEHAAVGPAAAAAADVGLQQDDPQRGLALGELVGGPEAGEAAADDADIGGDVLGQAGARFAGVGPQGVVEPVAAIAHSEPGDVGGGSAHNQDDTEAAP